MADDVEWVVADEVMSDAALRQRLQERMAERRQHLMDAKALEMISEL